MPRHIGIELNFVYAWGDQRMTCGDAGPAIPPIFRIDGQEFVGAVLPGTSTGERGHAAAKTEEGIGDLTWSLESGGRLPRHASWH